VSRSWAWLALALLTSCQSATEALIVVDNQGVRVPEEVDELRLLAHPADADQPLALTGAALCGPGVAAGACTALPYLWILTPDLQPGAGEWVIDVEARRRGQPVIVSRVRLAFQAGVRLVVHVPLHADCLGSTGCASAGLACGAGRLCVRLAGTATPSGGPLDALSPAPPDLAAADGGVGDGGVSDGGAPDLRGVVRPPWLSRPPGDLAQVTDLAGLDLLPPPTDLSGVPDLGQPFDLSGDLAPTIDDLALPVDDLAPPPDDLAVPMDFSPPDDLAVPMDFSPPDDFSPLFDDLAPPIDDLALLIDRRAPPRVDLARLEDRRAWAPRGAKT